MNGATYRSSFGFDAATVESSLNPQTNGAHVQSAEPNAVAWQGNGLPDPGQLSFVDFFAGAGLVRLGLEPGWECVWANDIDPKKQVVYETEFGAAGFVLGDVASVDGDSLPAGIDMAWASFPCQDLSQAGPRDGIKSGPRSSLYLEFARIMRECLMRGKRAEECD